MSKLKSSLVAFLALTTLLMSACVAADSETSSNTTTAKESESDAPALTVLEFGGPNVLFAADPVGEKIYAFELDDVPAVGKNLESIPYNIDDFGSQLSAYFDTGPFDISYKDLAVHPVTKSAFLTLVVRKDETERSALVFVNQEGQIKEIDISKLNYSSVSLKSVASDAVTFWRDIPAPSLTVTDLQFSEGVLYVAGLSTGEFASTLRKFEYPFAGSESTTSIEMFHAVHDQNETRAPIRAMTMINVDGVETLVAAYTCTPLVTVPVPALKDGEHVVGKTVAELGYGNRPVEVLSLTAYNMERQPEQFVLVINREMSANLIKMDDLVAASKAPGITTPFKGMGYTMGVAQTQVPLSGVVQADDQDAQFILLLKRNIDSGDMELLSSMKGAYFRLSDFVSEYNFPDYEYPENQKFTQQFHNLTKTIEGYPELIVE